MVPLVRIRGLDFRLPENRGLILQDINLEIRPGEHCALTGANGAGKSTLLRIMAGELPVHKGEVLWRYGNELNSSRIAAKAVSRLVSPLQHEKMRRQFWDISGADYLYGSFFGCPHDARFQKRAQDVLHSLDAMPLVKMRLPGMSEGQLRMLLLAEAILAAPPLLLLDECVMGLDERHRNLFFESLASFSSNSTIIFCTHRQNTVPSWIRKSVYLERGKLVDAPEVAQPPDHGVSRPNGHGGRMVFQLKDVSVFIERERILKNINWVMRQGENWLISGDNGSGKSTFLRLLAGDEFAAAGGENRYFSSKLGSWAKKLEDRRNGISLVAPLGEALYSYDLSGQELVCTGFDNSVGKYRDFSEYEISAARAMIERFFPEENWCDIAAASIFHLSTGQKRKLFLARSLMNKPDVLLLDEPLNGLDAKASAACLDLLDRLAYGFIEGFRPQLVIVSHWPEDIPSCITSRARMAAGELLP